MSVKALAISGACAGLSLMALSAPAFSTEKTPHAAFAGVWQITRPIQALRTIDGREPPLLPDAKAAYDRTRAQKKAGDTSWDPVYQCNMHGTPRIDYENMPFEILLGPKQIFFMYQWNREFRQIDLGPHSEAIAPTFMGQSVGTWEGETLLVDTNQFDMGTFLDADGMPHSTALHVVERYHVADQGKALVARITIDDPQTFSAPWDTEVRFRRLAGTDIHEDVCVERLNLPQYK